MSWTLVTTFLRQRATSPLRMILGFTMFTFPALIAAAAPGVGLQVLNDNHNIVFVLAVGMIGQDVAAGVLQLLFARPITRGAYVVSRWVAVGGAAAVLVGLQIALVCGILALRGHDPGGAMGAALAADRALRAIGIAAVMLLLSTLVSGASDLAIYVMLKVAGSLIELAGQFRFGPLVMRVGQEIQGFIDPHIDLVAIAGGAAVSWFAIASYLSTVTLCVALAILVMNRRELSYASG